MLRVLHVGYGILGRQIARDIEREGVGRVVAVVDPAPAEPGEREIAPDLASVAGVAVDVAVVTTRSRLVECADTFRALLERGLPVVSTCEELAYPWLRGADLAEELGELAKARGGKLLGTGINPGFLMDVFPAFAASVCRRVRGVRVERIQDAAPRRLPFREKIGAGLSLPEFRARAARGELGHVGLGESLHLLARSLGIEIDSWEETLDPVEGEAGRATGVRQVARGYAGDHPAVELVFHAAVGAPDPCDRIRIDGEPPVELCWEGGVPGDEGTSAVLLSSIPRLLAAPPGLHTMATVPVIGQ